MKKFGLYVGDKFIAEVKPVKVWISDTTKFSGDFEFYMKRQTRWGLRYYFRNEIGKVRAIFPNEIKFEYGKKYQLKGTL